MVTVTNGSAPAKTDVDDFDRAIAALAQADTLAAFQQALSDTPLWSQANLRDRLTARLNEARRNNNNGAIRDTLACRAFCDRLTPGWGAASIDPGQLPLGLCSPYGQLLQVPYARDSFYRRVELARSVLQTIDAASEPDFWAGVHNDKGDCLLYCEGAGRAEWIEEAIVSYEQALSIWDVQEYGSLRWARAFRNLATAYRHRVKGDREANLSHALKLYRHALEVRGAQRTDEEWVAIQHCIGSAWLDMPALDRTSNIKKAIAHYQDALKCCPRNAMPDQWSRITHDLAVAYSELPSIGRQQSIEQSIGHLETLLEPIGQASVSTTHSLEWARAKIVMGNNHIMRLTGDRTWNIERAIECYLAALDALSRTMHPRDWATANYNLAIAYWYALVGDRAGSVRRAILCCRRALRVYTAQAYPLERAHVLTALGAFYSQSPVGEHAANITKAIDCYQEAVNVRPRSADPEGWATAMSNLGNVYSDPVLADRRTYLDQAIACYEQALTVRTKTLAPEQWAETINNLGVTYMERIQGEPGANRRKAAKHLRQALQVYRPAAFPHAARLTARNLGHMLLAIDDWSGADKAYALAIEANEQLYKAAGSEPSRQAELSEAQDMFANRAYALARLGQPRAAVECLEAGRARILFETLALQRRTDETRLPEERQRSEEVVKKIRKLEAVLRDHVGLQQFFQRDERASLTNIEQELEHLYKQLPKMDDRPLFAAIDKAARSGCPLVYLMTTSAGSMALAVSHPNSQEETKLGYTRAKDILRRIAKGKQRQREAHVEIVWMPGFTVDDLDHMLNGAGGNTGEEYLSSQLGDSEHLADISSRLCEQIGERIIAPLAAHLRAAHAKGVTLVACGRLSLLPLHAASYRHDGRTLCFLDEFAVAYAPSAQVLVQARASAERRKAPLRLAGVGNPLPDDETLEPLRSQVLEALRALPPGCQPEELCEAFERLLGRPLSKLVHEGRTIRSLAAKLTGQVAAPIRGLAARWPASLQHARAELESIAAFAPLGMATTLYEQEATRGALLRELSGATVAHLACHGQFRVERPVESGIVLADEELKLRDLLAADGSSLADIRLVVLSACQTAITDFQRLPEEAIGLPGGFLQAGVPAVVGTLWSVDDMSTALLMMRWYELMTRGESLLPGPALRQAQGWLRDQTVASLKAYLTHHRKLARAQASASQRKPNRLVDSLLKEIMLKDDDIRPYASPYFWAPFTYHGAAEVSL